MQILALKEKIHDVLAKLRYEDSLRLLPFLIASFIAAGTAILYSMAFFKAE